MQEVVAREQLHKMEKKTAILIFAQSSTEELKSKAIYGGKDLFDTFNDKTVQTVESTGIPYFVFSEKKQQGIDFGERFTHAISEVYRKGFDYIITIGNDCPGLTKQLILKSKSSLENDQFVLGPSIDGGFYLMGLHQSLFNKDVFLNFSWKTHKLQRQVLEYIKSKAVRVNILKALNDIDTFEDLKKVLHSTIPFNVRKLILWILRSAVRKINTEYSFEIPQYALLNNFYNKGSPSLSF